MHLMDQSFASFAPQSLLLVKLKPPLPGRKFDQNVERCFFHLHRLKDNCIRRSRLCCREHNTNKDEDESSLAMMKSKTVPSYKNKQLGTKLYKSAQGINYPLLLSLILNQFFILFLSISVAATYVYFADNWQFLNEGILNWTSSTSPLYPSNLIVRIMEGIIASVPMILFGMKLQASDDRRIARANFSTIFMVMALFGRRSQISLSKQYRIPVDESKETTRSVGKSIHLTFQLSIPSI
jgi:hypothetical protein